MEGKIKFVAVNYWNKKTMTLTDAPTKEQWAEVEEIADNLTKKYVSHKGCDRHPDQEQKLSVGLFNDYVDIQLQKADTCQCPDIVEDLIAIRNYEMIMQNPNRYPHNTNAR